MIQGIAPVLLLVASSIVKYNLAIDPFNHKPFLIVVWALDIMVSYGLLLDPSCTSAAVRWFPAHSDKVVG